MVPIPTVLRRITIADRLYWPCWAVATLFTGVVVGLMLGYALLLGRFLDWLLTSGNVDLAAAYAAFRGTAGRAGLSAFYVVCGLQVLSVITFLALALATRRRRGSAVLAAIAGVAWLVAHYASGFATLEAEVLRSMTAVPPAVAARFVRMNGPVHLVHVATLAVALGALLRVPARESNGPGRPERRPSVPWALPARPGPAGPKLAQRVSRRLNRLQGNCHSPFH